MKRRQYLKPSTLKLLLILIIYLFDLSRSFTIQKYPTLNLATRALSRQEDFLPLIDSNYREIFNISDSLQSMEKLADRLQSCGVENFYFAHDDDPTHQLGQVVRGDEVILRRLTADKTRNDVVTHVKTLIWKGILIGNSTSDCDNEDKGGISWDDSFYFVTALRVEDKVDMRRLRAIIKDDLRKKRGHVEGTLILQLAEREQAEKITGFASGSMPPGWHSVPCKLYIDDYILESYNESRNDMIGEIVEGVQINSDGIGDNGSHYSKIMMSVGSGSSNFSLHVSLLDTIVSSVYQEDNDSIYEALGLESNSICTKATGRFITSFTRARAEQRNKERQRRLNSTKSSRLIIEVCEDGKNDNDLKKPLKLTRRLFHTTAKKIGKIDEVKQMIEILGDDFPLFMQVDAGTDDERVVSENNKNAIHYAAWKGSMETVTLLLNSCKRFQEELGDAVNTISTGEGCYGKTPIFYAITQCRDDMVLHLISQGACLLVVNNKGQSPCSLAVNKLKPETCQIMYDTEEAQLRAGGEFTNYRRSHSDGRSYGDLDPRFLDFGDINMDLDIQAEFDQFQEYILNECDEEKKRMSDSNPFLLHSITENCLPRSIRGTTPAMKQAIRSRDQEEKRLQKNGEEGKASRLSTLRSVRVTTPIWRQEAWLRKQEERGKKQVEQDEKGLVCKKEKRKKKSSSDPPSHIIVLEDGKEINMNFLETLRLQDVLQSASDGDQNTYELVDDHAGILALRFAVDETLSRLKDIDSAKMNDDLILSSSWGLDCEWRPSVMSGEVNPVATLQLSLASRSFVVDIQTLCKGGICDMRTEMTPSERALSETLSQLFSSDKIRIIGFGIAQDLSKLAASFPHMPCFRDFCAVLDLQSLIRLVYPDSPKHFMSSLQKATGILMKKRMDKTEQCSQWNIRPLRTSQLEYAALDATILPELLNKMLQDNPKIDEENGFFLHKNIGIQSSFRFTFLEDDGNCSYRITMGSIKNSFMELKFARQMWPTFKKDSPPLPQRTEKHKIEAQSTGTKEENVKKVRSSRVKRNAVDLTQLAADIESLPLAGKELGYTKDSCIEHILSEEVISSLPKDSYLRYNRRGGITEIGNCWMLFVNFGVGRIHAKYRNEFMLQGKMVTFTINPLRCEDGDLLQNLLIPDDSSSMSRKSVLLFMRGSSKEKFICCGKVSCRSHKHNEDNDMVHLVLELNQYSELKMDADGQPSNYMRIVSENTSDGTL